MAKENRVRRRFLAMRFLEIIKKTPSNLRAARVIKPSRKGEPFYVFVLLPSKYIDIPQKYREARIKLLELYCIVTKLIFPKALDIVGIAFESGDLSESGADALYFDARVWSSELEAEAKSIQKDLGLLTSVSWHSENIKEYPDFPKKITNKSEILKGRHRNALCWCNSGKKYKYCHGRS